MSVNVFISYSDSDRNKMEALRKALVKTGERFSPLVIAKRPSPNKPLSEKIQQAILDSSFVVPILTRQSVTNQWVNQEIGYATALNKNILPIVSKEVLSELKGFIHDQVDLPFHFEAYDSNPRKEARSFQKSYKLLIDYLERTLVRVFETSIRPKRVSQGASYKTTVKFEGYLENGFFDNLNEHVASGFRRWFWDVKTLSTQDPKAGGNLHGDVAVKTTYSCPTMGWPKGSYNVHVRAYDHPIIGKAGRYFVAEDVHRIEII